MEWNWVLGLSASLLAGGTGNIGKMYTYSEIVQEFSASMYFLRVN